MTQEETLLKNAKIVLSELQRTGECTQQFCIMCPASSHHNGNSGSCRISGRRDEEWLENYINKKENMKNEENKLVEIGPKRCKRMLVWDDGDERAVERIVIATHKCRYIAVDEYTEENYLNGDDFVTSNWENAKPLPEPKPKPKRLSLKQIAEKFGVDAVEIIEGEG